jgi:hypothetical protein
MNDLTDWDANPGTGLYTGMYTFWAGTANTATYMQFYPLLMTVKIYWHGKCRKKAGILVYCMVPYPEASVKCHGCGKVIARRKVKTAHNNDVAN